MQFLFRDVYIILDVDGKHEKRMLPLFGNRKQVASQVLTLLEIRLASRLCGAKVIWKIVMRADKPSSLRL